MGRRPHLKGTKQARPYSTIPDSRKMRTAVTLHIDLEAYRNRLHAARLSTVAVLEICHLTKPNKGSLYSAAIDMRVATQEWHTHHQPVTSQITHSHKINLTSFVRHGIQTFT